MLEYLGAKHLALCLSTLGTSKIGQLIMQLLGTYLYADTCKGLPGRRAEVGRTIDTRQLDPSKKSWQPPETLFYVCSALLSIPHALAMEEHQLLVQFRHLLNFGTLPHLSAVSRRNTLSRYQLIDTPSSQISSPESIPV